MLANFLQPATVTGTWDQSLNTLHSLNLCTSKVKTALLTFVYCTIAYTAPHNSHGANLHQVLGG